LRLRCLLKNDPNGAVAGDEPVTLSTALHERLYRIADHREISETVQGRDATAGPTVVDDIDLPPPDACKYAAMLQADKLDVLAAPVLTVPRAPRSNVTQRLLPARILPAARRRIEDANMATLVLRHG